MTWPELLQEMQAAEIYLWDFSQTILPPEPPRGYRKVPWTRPLLVLQESQCRRWADRMMVEWVFGKKWATFYTPAPSDLDYFAALRFRYGARALSYLIGSTVLEKRVPRAFPNLLVLAQWNAVGRDQWLADCVAEVSACSQGIRCAVQNRPN
jgi:hypothetical protein